jgi:putative SOS response-associated peptidase YedK
MSGTAVGSNVTWDTRGLGPHRGAGTVPRVCGRFVQVSSPELLVERFGVDELATPRHEPSYNVAPRATVYAVRDRVGGGGSADRRRKAGACDGDHRDQDDTRRRYLSELRWGLIPSWAKDPKIGDRMINARAESLADKPAYERAFRRHRCLVPADGFYEWQRHGSRKQPIFIHRRDGEPMAFAGLWAAWRDGSVTDAEWLRSCAIVTTSANGTVAPLHDRMPVVLEERDWDRWLDPVSGDVEALARLLRPVSDELLVAYPVGTAVNSADNDGPELVTRVEVEPSLGL